MSRELRARMLLAELDALGLSIEDLTAARAMSPVVHGPTVAEYLSVVDATYARGTAQAYRSYWRLLVAAYGERSVASIGYDDCAAVVDAAFARARSGGFEGRSARENCIGALRAYFERARRSGLVSRNPAGELDKPRRRPSRRRGLTDDELDQLRGAVAETSRDPELDLLLVEFHLESGARRQGAVSLRLGDVDVARSTVVLHEKFSIDREQPISPTLLGRVLGHAAGRGAVVADDAVFRTHRNRGGAYPALTRRRYNSLFEKAQGRLEWSARVPVTAHVLRHTGITRVERIAGMAVAAAFAGHRPATVTAGYTKAGIEEVASALARVTGEDHPLASPKP